MILLILVKLSDTYITQEKKHLIIPEDNFTQTIWFILGKFVFKAERMD